MYSRNQFEIHRPDTRRPVFFFCKVTNPKEPAVNP